MPFVLKVWQTGLDEKVREDGVREGACLCAMTSMMTPAQWVSILPLVAHMPSRCLNHCIIIQNVPRVECVQVVSLHKRPL
jgi:hypothetical protein